MPNDQPQSRKGEGLEPAELAAWLRKQAKDADLEMMFGTADRFRAAADLLTRSESTRVELGCPGHLIVASRCRWKRHTQVGNYRVSSIGDYYPDGDRGKRDTIGAGESSFFETLVFKTTDELDPGNEGCGCRKVAEWSEIDGERYATAGEAQAGHERYVEKYSRGERGG